MLCKGWRLLRGFCELLCWYTAFSEKGEAICVCTIARQAGYNIRTCAAAFFGSFHSQYHRKVHNGGGSIYGTIIDTKGSTPCLACILRSRTPLCALVLDAQAHLCVKDLARLDNMTDIRGADDVSRKSRVGFYQHIRAMRWMRQAACT